MNKLAQMKRKLVKEAGICGGILAVAGGGLFAAMTWESGLNEEMNQLNGNVSGVNGEIQNLQTQYSKAKSSLDLYNSLQDKRGIDETFSRDGAKKILDRLKEEYLIDNLVMTVTPTQEIKDSPVSTKTATLVLSDVTLKFDGMSDEQLFSFINALSKEFTGYLKFTKMELTRGGEISTDTLKSIGKGTRPTLVSAEIMFKWYGLKANAQPAGADGQTAANVQPGGAM